MSEDLQVVFNSETFIVILFILAYGVASFLAMKLTAWSDRRRRVNSEK